MLRYLVVLLLHHLVNAESELQPVGYAWLAPQLIDPRLPTARTRAKPRIAQQVPNFPIEDATETLALIGSLLGQPSNRATTPGALIAAANRVERQARLQQKAKPQGQDLLAAATASNSQSVLAPVYAVSPEELERIRHHVLVMAADTVSTSTGSPKEPPRDSEPDTPSSVASVPIILDRTGGSIVIIQQRGDHPFSSEYLHTLISRDGKVTVLEDKSLAYDEPPEPQRRISDIDRKISDIDRRENAFLPGPLPRHETPSYPKQQDYRGDGGGRYQAADNEYHQPARFRRTSETHTNNKAGEESERKSDRPHDNYVAAHPLENNK